MKCITHFVISEIDEIIKTEIKTEPVYDSDTPDMPDETPEENGDTTYYIIQIIFLKMATLIKINST